MEKSDFPIQYPITKISYEPRRTPVCQSRKGLVQCPPTVKTNIHATQGGGICSIDQTTRTANLYTNISDYRFCLDYIIDRFSHLNGEKFLPNLFHTTYLKNSKRFPT